MLLSELTPTEKRDLLKRLLQEKAATHPVRGALSYGQKALWFLHQFEPASAAYNLSFAARIRASVDVAALNRALQLLVDRHDSLRTTFAAAGGIPYREVQPRKQAQFQIVDASSWSWDEVRQRCETEARRLIDLEAGPLMRALLFERSHDESALLLVAHHLVGDFWSLVIILDELGALYRADIEGRPAALPRPTATYGDFARWQHDMLAGEEGRKLEAYWHRELGGDRPELSLPTDRPRPAVQTFNGAAHTFCVPQALTSRLKLLARDEHATLFAVLVAAYEVLLHRHSGQTDFLVGLPVAGRTQPRFRSVVGFFVNMVALRAKLAGGATCRALIADVGQRVIGALEHQAYPFARLVEHLAPARAAARVPFLQATIVLQKGRAGQPLYAITQAGTELEFGGVKLESLGTDSGGTQFDLTLFAEDVDGALLSALVYNSDLFDADRIARMADHFVRLLDGLVADPGRRVDELPMLTEHEEGQLEAWSSGPRVAHPTSLVHQAIEAQARATPDRTAVRFEDRQLTYRELNERANRVAHALVAARVAPDVIVGLWLERSLELVVAILAVLKAGGAYLPLDSKNPPERTGFITEDAGVEIVLTGGSTSRKDLPRQFGAVLNVTELWEQGDGDVDPEIDVDEEALAYVLYTSGSTGAPKGVMIPHRALCNHMAWMRREFPLDHSDRVLQKTPFAFDASVWEFFAPLMQGAELVVARPAGHEDVAYLARAIARHRITTLQMIPSLLALLVDDEGFGDCQSLRRVFCGGESLTVALAQRFHARSAAELVNLYGPTEACIDATFWRSTPAAAAIRIGHAIDNVSCDVLDPRGQRVPIGVAGELYIGGAGLARGYVRRPDLTADRFLCPLASGARLYRTGDLVRWWSDGHLEFLGRVDRQLKLRGVRIELEEIEGVLRQHPSVRQAAVICDEQTAAKRLVAYIVTDPQANVASEDVREFLRRRMPEYMVPAAFVVLERLPLTASGKTDYRALPTAAFERRGEIVPPRNATEAVLAQIWADALGLERVGVHDNFFELGGDSILSLQVVAHAQRAGLVVTLEQMLRFQTIDELADAVARAPVSRPGNNGHDGRGGDAASVLVPLQPLGAALPLVCVHPVEGSVHGFAALARLLGDDRPFYGIEAPELRDPTQPVLPATVEELASIYVTAVRARQPRGPYHVLGWSMGAAVAYEMAHQFLAAGEAVGFLGVLDQGARPREWARGSHPIEHTWLGPDLPALSEEFRDRIADGDVVALLANPRVAAALTLHPDPARGRRMLEIGLRNERALRRYVPPVTSLAVSLFRAAETIDTGAGVDECAGWAEVASGGVDVQFVPGNHFTMLRFPHVRQLAEPIKRALARQDGPR